MEPSKLSTTNVLLWTGILYFIEGFPYGLFFDLFPLWMRSNQMSLAGVGTLSLLGLAWSLKFLWAPIIDFVSHHKWWIFGTNLTMGACFVFMSFHTTNLSPVSWAILCVYALCSATNDSAIDGLTILISDATQLGRVNAVRAAAYRAGLICAGMILVLSGKLGWGKTFAISGIALWINSCFPLFVSKFKIQKSIKKEMTIRQEFKVLMDHPIILLGLIISLIGLLWPAISRLIPIKSALLNLTPVVLVTIGVYSVSRNISSLSYSQLGPAFGTLLGLLKRPGITGAIAFILLYRIGESASGFMVKPFWMDAGFSRQEIGLFSVNLGILLSIIGGIVGGWYIDRNSMMKSLWILGIIPSLANLLYSIAAHIALPHIPGEPVSSYARIAIYISSITDSFTGGLGASVFLTYLMKITRKEHASSEYAILASIFSFSKSISGWFGGAYAEIMGYSVYFFFTFLLCFPAYLFMPYVKKTLVGIKDHGNSS
ncbi:MFS transporter [Candidatus Ichthyocystis sparus]|uniref:MFS transporter n=1 Tax=Candidatus Ichthyocystis sparus TaxID=1561004 RepID=UPI00159EF2D1|nr:MFS transporter [Candidatus Ichthyocystis sparus]